MASSASRAAARLVPLLASLALLAAAPAGAATLCRLQSGTQLAFGIYDLLSPAPTDSLATIDVLCERNGGPRTVTVSVQLDAGLNGAGVQSRRLRHLGGSGDSLAYNLFRDVSRSNVWGFSDGVDTVTQTATIDNKDSATLGFTIYGRIPPLQDGTIGSYGDTVQITVMP